MSDFGAKALVALGRLLLEQGYAFCTPTPETHRRVLARSPGRTAATLRDVFGWSLPFARGFLPDAIGRQLERAGGLVARPDGTFTSAVRFSSLGGHLFVHSAYPTVESDSVFFGPDTYRFARMLRAALANAPRAKRAVDVGCGSGAGGLCIADSADRLVLADINPRALAYARANAELAGVSPRVEIADSDVLASVGGDVDLVIANPPYLVDEGARLYRDGGGALGTALSVRIARAAFERLAPGGRLLLYTATPILEGEDPLLAELLPLRERARVWSYEELDPDVFGEELDRPAYAAAERIAVVGLSAVRA